ncbi:uncharacterized protein LOC111295134 [Durio zibethinus]|uniref:Uncharacterized protein LOC111295134 n=1 Tax=Durio zibethinus TaxID=66656 RepID=A0A6P5YVF5_DURZI|nr:uncharacterized protein LOC111295134 [Durio zibethinus]
MSKKIPEEIDLNCDAVLVDRENEDKDVNGGEAETVTGRIVDAGVWDIGEDNESAGDGVAESRKESEIESVKNPGIDLEADSGSLGEEVDDEVSTKLSLGGISLMEVDGGSRGTGNGESVFMEDEKPVETEEMAVRSPGGVAEDLNVSVCPNEDSLIEGTSVPSSSIADNTIQSDIAPDSGSADEKPLSLALGHENSLPCGNQNISSKEESSSRLESRDMEIDTPDDTNKNQINAICGEGDRVLQNEENRSNLSNDAVDLNQCTSIDEDVLLDVNAKPEKPEERDFYVSDLVWGKVRSHPWWPGQIFDHLAATAKAKKYFKKDCYLIAYFGDQTFAWNEASRIKPFMPNFSHMEKQNNMEEFQYAVDCALDEVSRRVEFGLACSCISEEAYAQVKTQIIVNTGIREESSRRDGGDRFSSAAFFDPFELVETMKALAQSPYYSEVDRLQFIKSQAQLLAFLRWKGYSKLPEFQNLCGLDTDAKIPLSKEVKKCSKLIENDVPSVKVDKEKPESRGGSCHKRKKIPTVSSKSEKSLSEFIAERRLSLQNGKRKLNNKTGDKLISSSPAKN